MSMANAGADRVFHLVRRFLESMKMPASTKPTSGFHICDILELNKEQHQKSRDEDKAKADEACDEDELKRENLSCESDENGNESAAKRKHSPSPSITRDSQSPTELAEPKKPKKLDAPADHHQLLSQYPHLFQNHPAMRPWFNSSRK